MSVRREPWLLPRCRRAAIFLISRTRGVRPKLFGRYHRYCLMLGQLQITRTRYGAMMLCDLTDKIGSYIYHFGHWEPNLSYLIHSRLTEGCVFIDVGSNLGYYALLASPKVGLKGSVVAIEASPKIFRALEANIDLNHFANIRPINVAVSDRRETLTIYAGPDHNLGSSSTLKHWREGVPEAEVPALPLNEILTPDELRRTRLIKIDVEGAEGPILAQLLDTIDLYSPNVEIVVEVAPSQTTTWDVLVERFKASGFRAYGIDNRYNVEWYLDWRRTASPYRLQTMPVEQTDVLFSRLDLESVGAITGGTGS